MSHDFKIGDEIVIKKSGMGIDELLIQTVETITKTGRIKTKLFEINPDLTIRNKQQRWGPYYQCLGKPTDEHRRILSRDALENTYVRLARKLLPIQKISDDDLNAVIAIYKKYQKKDD